MNGYKFKSNSDTEVLLKGLQLKRCLTSLSWCSEIYVVDSGSTDGSIELAKMLGAEVAVNKPEGRFLITEQRNWALVNLPITSEWVIFLDSDEEIKEKCKDLIEMMITQRKNIIKIAISIHIFFTNNIR